MKPFPLVPWLEKNGVKAYTFARDNGINLRSIYSYCEGNGWRRPNASSFLAIEAGTNGEVSLRELLEWAESRRADANAA